MSVYALGKPVLRERLTTSRVLVDAVGATWVEDVPSDASCLLTFHPFDSIRARESNIPWVAYVPTHRYGLEALQGAAKVFVNASWYSNLFPSATVLHPPIFPADYKVNRRNPTNVVSTSLKGRRFLHVVKDKLSCPVVFPDEERYPYVDVRSHFANARVLVTLAEPHEPSGRIGLEAMCSGIPVVAWRNPAYEERMGEYARLVDYGDVDELLAVLRNTYEDPTEWEDKSRVRASSLQHEAELSVNMYREAIEMVRHGS